ncbi:MAG: hypothetical protein ACR2OI_04775 [Acidimicrobiia bacterium]
MTATTTMTGTMKKKTTTTDPLSRPGQRPLLGAVVAFALLLGACSSGDDAVVDPTPTAQLPTQTSSVPEARTTLQSALARYDAGYEFTSQAVVNGSVALEIDGRHVSGSSHMTITSGDGEVGYLIVGGSQWATTPGGEWEVVSEGEAGSPPLQALKSPAAVEMAATSGSEVKLTARYPGSAFQLIGPELEVTLTIEDGLLAKAEYMTEQDGVVGHVETTFRPLSDFTPITVP